MRLPPLHAGEGRSGVILSRPLVRASAARLCDACRSPAPLASMDMTDTWIFPDWPAPARVHAVSTREGPGVSAPPFGRFNLGLRSGESTEVVDSNRSVLQQAMNLPSAPRWLHQVHGSTVAELGPLPSEHEPQADAAVSRIPGTVLAILTADCLPVLFCA